MIAILFLAGLMVGSFLNVCIDRLPRGQSIISPPSHCDSCGRRLMPWDLVPVLSYLWLRGKCRHCQTPISPRLPLVELSNGVLFAYMGYQYELSWQLIPALLYGAIFILIFVVDLEQGLILNVVVYPGMALAIALSPLWPGVGLWGALGGGGAGFALMLAIYLAFKGGMGAGDVKLAALIGFATGFPGVFLALFLSVVLGGVTAALLLLSRRKGRKDPIAFGPFLALGAQVTLMWGPQLSQWYLAQLRL